MMTPRKLSTTARLPRPTPPTTRNLLGGFSDFPDEYDDDDDADAEAADTRTAAQGGTPDSSLVQFLAEWDDEGSASHVGDSDAAPRARPPKVPTKRPRAAGS